MVQVGKWGEGRREWIEYCPLHISAEEMLKVIVDTVRHGPNYEQLRDLIAKASGGRND